jgi:hypothetical protein
MNDNKENTLQNASLSKRPVLPNIQGVV